MNILLIVVPIITCVIGYYLGKAAPKMKKVANKNRKFGSNADYYRLEDGGERYLFTRSAIMEAKARADYNQEDFA